MIRVAGLIPVFNQVRWVRSAVLSMVDEVEELAVVDDGSTDGTVDVLQGLRDEFGFTLIEHSETRGVSEACNAGVAALKSEIVLLQGGDDRTLPGRGARSRDVLSDDGVSLVYSQPAVIDADDQRLPDDTAQEFAAGLEIDDPLHYLFNVGNFVCAPSTAFRREDYIAAGGFPAGVDLLQDYALWLELGVVGRFEHVDQPLVEYRKHASNLSREYMGVDTSRKRRHAAELAWIRNRFLDRVDASTLHRVSTVPLVSASVSLNRDDVAMLARLVHSSRPLVRLGLDQLFTRIANHGNAELARLGLTRQDVAYFAECADHDDLEQLGRAVATVQRLTDGLPTAKL